MPSCPAGGNANERIGEANKERHKVNHLRQIELVTCLLERLDLMNVEDLETGHVAGGKRYFISSE